MDKYKTDLSNYRQPADDEAGSPSSGLEQPKKKQ